ncbi:P protein-like isoform X2 [Saccostrea cucullata]|uniref:P protein-like isoform X2 n=1 Tax=Saccostrea cuccullata TaxID=36930 RepID=UPI002ED3725D
MATGESNTSDLQTLLHYNRPNRPKSTPPTNPTKEESTLTLPNHQYRAASVIPFGSRTDDETTPLMGVIRGNSDTFVQHEEEEETAIDKESIKEYFSLRNKWTLLNHLKILILVAITFTCCIFIMTAEESEKTWRQLSLGNEVKYEQFKSNEHPVRLFLKGPISESKENMTIPLSVGTGNKSETWTLNINTTMLSNEDTVELEHKFTSKSETENISFELTSNQSVPLLWRGEELPTEEIVYAALILLFVYAMIIFELVHRTLAAILGSLAAIAVLSSFHKGIEFSNFTLHMFVGILFVSIVGYGALRFLYRDITKLQNQDPPEIAELKHEIDLWKRAAARVSVVSREESIMKALFQQKAAQRENALIRQIYRMKRSEKKSFQQNVKELERKYYITDRWLLVKTGIVLTGVILCFFLHSFIDSMHIGLGWIAVMGAIFLLVVADIKEMENILHRVEWATLIFFAALFVLMEALTELQLIDWIGDKVSDLISGLDKGTQQNSVAILLVLWVSAIASSFIDNIPYTTAMIPVLVKLSEDQDIPIFPLTFSLAFGACLGGNGTLIGASANVVCAGIAEQHGYGFSFKEFFKVGFPLMLVTTMVAMVYLLICHVALDWN